MKIVSFYTKNNRYEEVINKFLLPSLKKFKLDYQIESFDNLGTWNQATSFKSNFILQSLDRHQQDIIWIDADATIEQYPKLLFEIPSEYDIAVFYLDWDLQYRKNTHKYELISATMMFRHNPRVITFVQKWIKACKDYPNIWEQKVLQNLLEKDDTLKVYKLPVDYCSIVLQNNKLPGYIKNPIIIQHQASREYKNG